MPISQDVLKEYQNQLGAFGSPSFQRDRFDSLKNQIVSTTSQEAGLDSQTVELLLDAYSGTDASKLRGRSQLDVFGPREYAENVLGGYQNIARQVFGGTKFQQKQVPLTTLASGGKTGGFTALAPIDTPEAKVTDQGFQNTAGFEGPEAQEAKLQESQRLQQTGNYLNAPTAQQNQLGATTPQNQQTLGVGDSSAPGGVSDATLTGQQVGGKFGTQQFGKVGNDVFEIMSDGSRRHVTEAEFNQKLRAQGLNLEAIPQLDPADNISDTPGGTSLELDEFGETKSPSDFVADYQSILSELGITDIKGELDTIKKQYEDLNNEKLDKIADVNMNPWLSEGLRSKQISSIETKYEGKLDTLTNQLELFNSMYEEAISTAKFLTSGTQEDRNKLLDIALKKEQALAQLLKDDKEKYDLREVDGSLYRVDKKSGKSELLIKGTSATQKPTEGEKELYDITAAKTRLLGTKGSDGYVDPQVYLNERSKSKTGPDEFDKRLSYLLSPKEKKNLLEGGNVGKSQAPQESDSNAALDSLINRFATEL